ncbi:MAG: adenylate/guanylate cyclase domain-containing protein [Bacteroidota bacterium]
MNHRFAQRFFWIFCLLCSLHTAHTQDVEYDIKVYSYAEGLPHRNVFDLLQDESGYLWMATLQGVVRFDGYDFYRVPQAGSSISKLALDGNRLYSAGLDSIVQLDLRDGSFKVLRLKDGEYVRRQSTRPLQMIAANGRVYVVVQEELSGQVRLLRVESDGSRTDLRSLASQAIQRPFVLADGQLWFAEQAGQLLAIDLDSGEITASEELITADGPINVRLVDLKASPKKLWALSEDGKIYSKRYGEKTWNAMRRRLPVSKRYRGWQCLELGPRGEIFVGGRGELWQYAPYQDVWIPVDPLVRKFLRNNATYTRLLYDASGTLWAATDFGAVRINRKRRFFEHYLSGGLEMCSNFFCSIRGMTEDSSGHIYISYYNAIHKLNPKTDELEPLFPSGDFFNAPFGLRYHDGHLYTGNGLKIRLSDRKVESLFGASDDEGEGSVVLMDDGHVWFGKRDRLHWHDPETGETQRYIGSEDGLAGVDIGEVETLMADYEVLWIGTKESGLYELNIANDRIRHWSAAELPSGRVTAIYRAGGTLWAGTGAGLAKIDLANGRVKTYTAEQGLSNNFINGILPEGDSMLWLSTDYGLSRFSAANQTFDKFVEEDGISANEFNRSSYLKSSDGRMYFGGLDGVNAFYPSQELVDFMHQQGEVPLNLTQLSYIDGTNDSVHQMRFNEIENMSELDLGYQNRQFTFDVSLADYREPQDNRYSYWIENLTNDWSEEAPEHTLRVPDLPPGEYTLHVRARSGQGDWVSDSIDLPIRIRQPYYQNFWFWVITLGIVSLGFVMLYRYRAKTAELRQKELEREVAQRTAELGQEKAKADQLLLNILPAQTAEELKQTGKASAKRHEQVTIVFSDFVGFTAISNQLEPEELVKELDHCFRTFDKIVAQYDLEKIKTIGDAYLFVGGLNSDAQTGAVDSLKAARDIQMFLKSYAKECQANNRPVFRARLGIHTGPLVTGVVGTNKFAYDIWGKSVNIASRMESNGQVDSIVVSEATQRLVGTQFDCRPFGLYEEHGKQVEMYLVE